MWEISQKKIIDLAADRQPFVDQSQSLNIYISDLTMAKFNAIHFHGWNKGLKTGCYYLRSQPAIESQKFTFDETLMQSENEQPKIIGMEPPCDGCGA